MRESNQYCTGGIIIAVRRTRLAFRTGRSPERTVPPYLLPTVLFYFELTLRIISVQFQDPSAPHPPRTEPDLQAPV
jgi:hypothetical protein